MACCPMMFGAFAANEIINHSLIMGKQWDKNEANKSVRVLRTSGTFRLEIS